MNPRTLYTVALVVVTLAGIRLAGQKIDVKVNVDETVSFEAVTTYSWLKSPPVRSNIAPDAVTNPNLSQAALEPHIIAAIDRELISRGMRRVETDPDVRAVYYAALDVGIDASELGSYYQYTTGWALPFAPGSVPNSDWSVYEQGTIVVDLIGRVSNKAIWRGSVSTRVNHENTGNKRIARIDQAMERLFSRFPKRKVANR